MSDAQALEHRLDALEIHVAHQAQAIDDLHAALAAQWTLLDGVKRQLSLVSERLAEAESRDGAPAPSQKPPHY